MFCQRNCFLVCDTKLKKISANPYKHWPELVYYFPGKGTDFYPKNMTELFNSLSEKELDRFDDFLRSVYFNNNASAVRLFAYLRKFHPRLSNDHISRKEISLNIYYRLNSSAASIRKLLSRFRILLADFLLQSESEKNVFSGKIAFLNAVKSRKDVRSWRKSLNELNRLHSSEKALDERYYGNSISIYNENYEFDVFKGNIRSANILKCIESINLYFIYQSLLAYSSWLLNNNPKKDFFSKSDSLFTEALSFAERNLESIRKNHQGIAVYYYITRMFSEYDDRYSDELVNYYNRKKRSMDAKLKEDYHILIMLYHIRKIDYGKGDELANRKELLILSDKVFFRTKYYEKYLSGGRFLNSYIFLFIIKNALLINEIKWAEKFISRYGRHLLPVEKTAASDIAGGIVKFFKREYKESLEILNSVTIHGWRDLIELKVARLMIWIETDNHEIFKTELASFLKTLEKNKRIYNPVKSQLKTLCYYLNKIHRIKTSGHKDKRKEAVKLKSLLKSENIYIDYKLRLYQILKSVKY